jgi:hypothetical protein
VPGVGDLYAETDSLSDAVCRLEWPHSLRVFGVDFLAIRIPDADEELARFSEVLTGLFLVDVLEGSV